MGADQRDQLYEHQDRWEEWALEQDQEQEQGQRQSPQVQGTLVEEPLRQGAQGPCEDINSHQLELGAANHEISS